MSDTNYIYVVEAVEYKNNEIAKAFSDKQELIKWLKIIKDIKDFEWYIIYKCQDSNFLPWGGVQRIGAAPHVLNDPTLLDKVRKEIK